MIQEIKPECIFPKIYYDRKINRVELETYVRIERGGEYYTLLFKEKAYFPLGEIVDPLNVANAYQRIIENVYIAIHHYQIADWHIPDTDQTPEAERLTKIYPFFSIEQITK